MPCGPAPKGASANSRTSVTKYVYCSTREICPIRIPKDEPTLRRNTFGKSCFAHARCTLLVPSTLQLERRRTTCDVLLRRSHTFWIHAGTFDYHGAGRRDRSPSCDDQGSSRNTVAPSCEDPGSRLQCLLKVLNLLNETSHSEN